MTAAIRIRQVNTSDIGGGAERVALDLHRSYRALGHQSTLAVGGAQTAEGGVLEIPNEAARGAWARTWRHIGAQLQPLGSKMGSLRHIRALANAIGEPRRTMQRIEGQEDFVFPGTW